jgi:pimeloyl-ACP methyl ester carboxylesterase
VATYVLIHGAAGSAWDWHLLEPELRERGHEVVAVDLPCDDESADFTDYAGTVIDVVSGRSNLIIVAHSLGGFTGPLVCAGVPVDLLVLLAAMIPSPGERPQDWWAATGYEQARREESERDDETRADDDVIATFFHDVDPDLAAEAMSRVRHQASKPMQEPWPLDAWPDVLTRFLLCRDDRFFPPAFMHRVARERLGITPDEMDGGHCVAISRPRELAERLETYRRQDAGWSPR